MMLSRRALLSLALGSTLTCTAVAAQSGQNRSTPAFPSWDAASKTIDAFFARDPKRQPLDVISQNQVKPLFAELSKLGWRVTEQEAILKRVPAENDFLVQQLRTKNGTKFMREFSKYRGGYDSLDRLIKLPHGKDSVRALIKGPDGYKLLEYMDTTEGGYNLEKQLSHAPKGKNFTKPTGRIYTAPQLKDMLKRAYAEDAATRAR